MIEHLPLGKQVTLATPPGVEGYAEYNRVTNLEVSAGYGVPYEALTGDFGNTNFSSGKIGQLEFGHNLDTWQYIMLRPQFHTGIWPWIMQAMLLPANGVRGIWTPPRRPILDMTKEIPAFISEIRGGLNSWSERVRTLGYDPEELLEQMKEDQKNLDAAGIVLYSDARRPASGAWQLAPDAPVQSDQKKKE
jgi:capsid protein